MTFIGLITMLAAALLMGGCAATAPGARPAEPGLHAFTLETPAGTMPYTVWLPPGYDPSRRWPLIVFFHGSGESGSDGSKQVWQGLGLALMQNPQRWPAIVVLPQKPDKREWDQFDAMVWPLLDRVARDWPIDPDRVVLTGVSQGGKACWHFGAQQPERFAALAPVAARSVSEAQAARLARTPVWLSHGEKDPVIKVDEARTSVARLGAVGNPPRVTLYPEAGHVSWNEFYGDEQVAAWLVAKTRRTGP